MRASNTSLHVIDSSSYDPTGNIRYVSCYCCGYRLDTWTYIFRIF